MGIKIDYNFVYKQALITIKEVGLRQDEIAYVDTAPMTTQVYIKASAVDAIKERLGQVPFFYGACAFNITGETNE